METVGEFESHSVPLETKGTAYEPRETWLTEKSRDLLTPLFVFGWHRTFDSQVNSLRERYNRPRHWANRGDDVKSLFTTVTTGCKKEVNVRDTNVFAILLR
jgi:hypothetical protein